MVNEIACLAVSARAAAWDGTRRADALRALESGALHELEFEAIVFRSTPNRNHLRIRNADLPEFAASFVGVPFLRDHHIDQVEARAGIVVKSALVQGASDQAVGKKPVHAIRQTIRLTTQRDMRAFLEGQIDRFSIAWYYAGVRCSVCQQEWGRCHHKPGRTYQLNQSGQHGRRRMRCELVFDQPRGKEVSAVNAPAVEGTGVLSAGGGVHKSSGVTARDGARLRLLMEKENHMAGELGEAAVATGVAAVGAQSGGTGMRGMGSAHLSLPSPLVEEALVSEDDMPAGSLPADAVPADAWMAALRAQVVDGMLARSGLSAGGMGAVRTVLQGDSVLTPQRVQQVIDAQRAAELALRGGAAGAGRSVVQGLQPAAQLSVTLVRTAEEEVQAALNWLMGDTRAQTPAPHLRNLRDIYLAVTGDINFWGVFNPDHARLQSANSGTLAGMAVNALNKAVLLHYDNMVTYRWYEPIVHVLPHDGSTQPLQLIHMDGIAALPAVAEGAAYIESTTGDSKETASFGKYGAYVGITLEMIRRSEIARIQAIPRLLVQAAIRRRSATVAALFTGNPTLADDNTQLFHTNHGNSDTAAFSASAWEAARTRIFGQQVPGTGKPLALWPTFCLVPIALYDEALTTFGYGSGDAGKPNSAGTAQQVNVYGQSRPGDPRPIPIVVPEWSDANDWAYIVDPRLQPVLVMAYANTTAGGAHALPEIFEVRSESAGLLFSNDVLPVKIRDWWALGVATHVGIGRNSVAE